MKRVLFYLSAIMIMTGLLSGCNNMARTADDTLDMVTSDGRYEERTDDRYGNVSTTNDGTVNGTNRGRYATGTNRNNQRRPEGGYVKYPNSYSGTPMGGDVINSELPPTNSQN